MIQPTQPQITTRNVIISCFTCKEEVKLALKPWELDKKITCPKCYGKQAVILSAPQFLT